MKEFETENALVMAATPENATDLIVVAQLPIIEEQLHQIKPQVEAMVADAMTLEATEETVKTVKERRAELNKISAAFEERRKEVKKAVLSPYEQFEAVYKECVSDPLKAADTTLKSRIASVEDAVKDQKKTEAEQFFNEYAQSVSVDFVSFSALQIPINLSVSMKKTKEEIRSFLDKTAADAQAISNMEFADEIMAEYRTRLNLSESLIAVTNRHKAIEEERKRAEERKIAEAERAEAEKKAREAYEAQVKAEAPIAAPVAAPVVQPVAEPEQTKELCLKFTVYGTLEQLKALKKFLVDGGYKYE